MIHQKTLLQYLSAPNGDANGDLDVNMAISIVAFMLFDDPQPFLFDAGDINSDDFINVLDIIGVVDILLNSDNMDLNNFHRMHH